MNSIGQDLES